MREDIESHPRIQELELRTVELANELESQMREIDVTPESMTQQFFVITDCITRCAEYYTDYLEGQSISIPD